MVLLHLIPEPFSVQPSTCRIDCKPHPEWQRRTSSQVQLRHPYIFRCPIKTPMTGSSRHRKFHHWTSRQLPLIICQLPLSIHRIMQQGAQDDSRFFIPRKPLPGSITSGASHSSPCTIPSRTIPNRPSHEELSARKAMLHKPLLPSVFLFRPVVHGAA